MTLLAAGAVALLCAWFRYLPMTDLPQHHAMVSILVHGADPEYGFGRRYLVDFWGHPYAVPYLVGAGLARLVTVEAAMRVVVVVCTVAPLAGLYLLLRACGRPALHCLVAVPLLFGHLWHWGFLNFLLGAGLLQATLAVAVTRCGRSGPRSAIALLALSLLLLFTHVHCWAVLALQCLVITAAATDWRAARARLDALAWPLMPSLVLAALFIASTWRAAEGFGRLIMPGPDERVAHFTTFAAAGLPDPWPAVLLSALALSALLVAALGRWYPPAQPHAPARLPLGLWLVQLTLYFLLPLQTSTANYVYPRQALLVLLAAIPLLPPLSPRGQALARPALWALAVLSLLPVAGHLRRFDAEAGAFDSIVAATPWDRRIGAAIRSPGSATCSTEVFPYLHFGAYLQARRGGDLTMSFASHWNIPVRYRSDHARPPSPPSIEWRPELLLETPLGRRFDLLLVRDSTLRSAASLPGFRTLVTSGPFRLLAPAPAAGAGEAAP